MMYDNRQERLRCIIAGVELDSDISSSMDELAALCEAAEIDVAGRVIQPLPRINSATYMGSGKLSEICELAENMDIDLVVFNDELSGSQIRNIEDRAGIKIIDRTMLILDIFAKRAVSKEGALQVELAMLSYRLPRLTGFGKALSRQGGGIGTRGPGEKRLETDRRHIRKRMDDIRRELRKAGSVRSTQSKRRNISNIPVVALAGYTNSGKSAIMNRMLAMSEKGDKDVFEKDMLFATLDPSHRSVCPGGDQRFILIDTVGFVSRLPHTLVEAFKSTLEEVRDADLIVHVVDASAPDHEFRYDVTKQLLDELGCEKSDTIVVYNKMDIVDEKPLDASGKKSVYISAKTGEGFDGLVGLIEKELTAGRYSVRLTIPYSDGNVVSYLMENSKVHEVSYTEEGTVIECELTREEYMRVMKYAAV